MRLSVLCSLAIVFSVAATSCMARGGLMGALKENLDYTVPAVHGAYLKALKAEGISIKEEKSDGSSGIIKANFADGGAVTIHTVRLTEKASTVTVQVGAFGNDVRQQALQSKAKGYLNQ